MRKGYENLLTAQQLLSNLLQEVMRIVLHAQSKGANISNIKIVTNLLQICNVFYTDRLSA